MAKITKISTGFLSGNLIDGWDDQDQYDEDASAKLYAEMLTKALSEAYPGVEIEVNWQGGAVGCKPRTLNTDIEWSDWIDDNGVVAEDWNPNEGEWVDEICSRIWEGQDWVIML